MVNPGEPSAEDRDDWTDHLVRPYVIDSDDAADGAPDDPDGNSAPGGFFSILEVPGASAPGWPQPAGPSVHDTAPLPADVPAGHRRPGGRAGRRLTLGAATRKWYLALAVYRLSLVIGAAIVIVTFAGGVLLLVLPSHSVTALAGKCRPSPSGCHQIAPAAPGAVAPVAVPSSSAHLTTAATFPAASWVATAETTARQATGTATATVIATATAARSVAPTGAPSATATATRPRPSPTPTSPGLTPGSTISIRATTACCTSYYIRHDDNDNRVVITQITPGDSSTTKADATWIVQTGLANSSCVSFKSANDPGQYLRSYDFELYLDSNDGSSQFARDVTFCPQPGNSGQGYSFQSVSYPSMYIRHYDYVVYIASDGGSNRWDNPKLWPDDSTWLVSQPWG